MPSNAQMFTDYYAKSVVDYWDKQRTEARALLVRERGEQDAYIKSIEAAIRAADDDIRGWAQVSDARERATRQSILQADRNRAYAARARSRATSSPVWTCWSFLTHQRRPSTPRRSCWSGPAASKTLWRAMASKDAS